MGPLPPASTVSHHVQWPWHALLPLPAVPARGGALLGQVQDCSCLWGMQGAAEGARHWFAPLPHCALALNLSPLVPCPRRRTCQLEEGDVGVMHPLFHQTCQQWMAFMSRLGMCQEGGMGQEGAGRLSVQGEAGAGLGLCLCPAAPRKFMPRLPSAVRRAGEGQRRLRGEGPGRRLGAGALPCYCVSGHCLSLGRAVFLLPWGWRPSNLATAACWPVAEQGLVLGLVPTPLGSLLSLGCSGPCSVPLAQPCFSWSQGVPRCSSAQWRSFPASCSPQSWLRW